MKAHCLVLILGGSLVIQGCAPQDSKNPLHSKQTQDDAVKSSAAVKQVNHSADDLLRLATSARDSGKYADAEQLYKEALVIYEKSSYMLDVSAVKCSEICDLIGWVNLKDADYEEAIQWYSQALAIKEKSLWPNHIKLVDTLIGLGCAYGNIGKTNKAKRCLQQAFEIRKAVLKQTDPDYINARNLYIDFLKNHHMNREAKAVLSSS